MKIADMHLGQMITATQRGVLVSGMVSEKRSGESSSFVSVSRSIANTDPIDLWDSDGWIFHDGLPTLVDLAVLHHPRHDWDECTVCGRPTVIHGIYIADDDTPYRIGWCDSPGCARVRQATNHVTLYAKS